MKPFLCWFFAVVLVLYLDSVQAWTQADTNRQLGISVLMLADAAQTMDIRNHSDLEEVAPVTKWILGRNPEPLETSVYFAASIGINYAIARTLPPRYRKVFQYVYIGFEGAIVANNHYIGLRVPF